MRELRPLNLPRLVAARERSETPTEEVTTITNNTRPAVASRNASYRSASSTAPSPDFWSTGQSPFPSFSSTASSCACSPTATQPLNAASSQFSMPGPPEDASKDTRLDHVTSKLYLRTSGIEQAVTNALAPPEDESQDTIVPPLDSDLGNGLGDDNSLSNYHSHSRQTSNDSPTSYSTRWGDRLPNFTRRWVHRKDNSNSTGAENSFAPSSRSSSFASSYSQGLGIGGSMTSLPRLRRSSTMDASPLASPAETSAFPEYIDEPIDRKVQSSTPLLPPVANFDSQRHYTHPSPLQSPAIADANKAASTFCAGGQEVSQPYYERVSKSLSERPSLVSLHRMRTCSTPSGDTAAPLIISAPDKWSLKLGHANFTIFPEPWAPEDFDFNSFHRLMADWEEARNEYLKHQARTLEHYGPTSNHYKYTEEKWAEIDNEWKRNVRDAKLKAIAYGVPAAQVDTQNPLLGPRMPSINPHVDGKFPKLDDADIIGPMVQLPPRPQPPRKTSKVKMISGLFGKGLAEFR